MFYFNFFIRFNVGFAITHFCILLISSDKIKTPCCVQHIYLTPTKYK
jgi:hypothetical protein